jgi:hypothetical protein
MAEGSQRRRRVDKQHRTPGHQVEIAIVAGPQGADFRPTSLTIPAGTVCLWRNQSGQTQDVLPVDDGPPLKGVRCRQGAPGSCSRGVPPRLPIGWRPILPHTWR